MAQWIKTLVTKPDDLSSILNLYMVERTDLHMHFLQAHTKLISNCKKIKVFLEFKLVSITHLALHINILGMQCP